MLENIPNTSQSTTNETTNKRKKEEEREWTSIENEQANFSLAVHSPFNHVSTYGRWTRKVEDRRPSTETIVSPSIATSEIERDLLIAARRSRTRPAERHEIGPRDDPVTLHKSSRFHVEPLHDLYYP